jgi:hypothetical protein
VLSCHAGSQGNLCHDWSFHLLASICYSSLNPSSILLDSINGINKILNFVLIFLQFFYALVSVFCHCTKYLRESTFKRKGSFLVHGFGGVSPCSLGHVALGL